MPDLPEFASANVPPVVHSESNEPLTPKIELLKAGFIGKEGHLFKTWRSRWCILRSILPSELRPKGEDVGTTHVLVYYKSKHDAVTGGPPCGAHVIAKGHTVTTRTTRAGRDCLKIETPGFDKVYYIQPFTDFDGWLKVLTDLEPPPNSDSLHPRMVVATGALSPVPNATEATRTSHQETTTRRGVSAEVLQVLVVAIQRAYPGVTGDISTRNAVTDVVLPATQNPAMSYLQKVERANHSFTGVANVFVSHAWNCNVLQLLDTLIQYSKEHTKPVFFWLDFCCLNQHTMQGEGPAVSRRSDGGWWTKSFSDVIRACKRMLVVAAPSSPRAGDVPSASMFVPPMVCTRAWCLLEMATAVTQKIDVVVRSPPAVVVQLHDAFVHDADSVIRCINEINSETASASEHDDLVCIWQVIEVDFRRSYGEVNECARSVLRGWVAHYGLHHTTTHALSGAEEANLATQLGNILQRSGDVGKAIEFFNKSLAVQLRTLGVEHTDTKSTYVKLGCAYEALGKYDRATELFSKALVAPSEGNVVHDAHAAVAYLHLGDVQQKQGAYDRAIELYEKALQTQLESPDIGPTHPDTATTYNSLGLAHKQNGAYHVALEHYSTALRIRRATLGDNHLATGATYNNIGGVYHMQNSYDLAVEYYQKALDILLTHAGEEAAVETTHVNLGSVCQQKGDGPAAIRHYERALAVTVRLHGSDQLQTAEAYNHLGGAHHNNGSYANAVGYYHSALAIMLNVVGTTHPNTALAYNNLGGSYQKNGNYSKAIDYYTRSMDIMTKALGSGHPVTATSYHNIGSAYESLGDYDSALDYYSKCLSIMLTANGAVDANTASAFANVGAVHDKRGESAKAIEYCTKAHDALTTALGSDHPSTKRAEKTLAAMKTRQQQEHSATV
eukprot:m.973069 g.973069  ORF g.973069 m.973069 type:complete len:898 (-) comp23932_c3_seq20:2-2695(-)